LPDAQARKSCGPADENGVTKEKSCRAAFPAPPPPPADADPEFDTPKLKDSIWISSLCLASGLSPLMPEILRNASKATVRSPLPRR
jgi:hypothetical protein